MRILLADDDTDDRAFLREAIESVRVDHALYHFENGEKLMEHLAQCNGNVPDLIFLDLNMPRKNGMECLTEIRTKKKFNDTMIAIYSTSAMKNDIDRSFHAGANIYIRKPNSYGALQKIVTDVLSINWQYHTSQLKRENFVMVR
jgi:CheY-like chemotaxis protein